MVQMLTTESCEEKRKRRRRGGREEEKVTMVMFHPPDYFSDSLRPIIDGVTKTQRGKVTCLGPHSKLIAKHRHNSPSLLHPLESEKGNQ